jgi:hypothetical protein
MDRLDEHVHPLDLQHVDETDHRHLREREQVVARQRLSLPGKAEYDA